jgi:hypothetical protein
MATKKATAKRAVDNKPNKKPVPKKKNPNGPRKVISKVDGMPIIRRPKKRRNKVSM